MGKPDTHPSLPVDPSGEFAMAVPEHLFYLLFQTAYHRDQRLGERLAKVGVTVPRWRSLAVVRRLGECSMTELARFTAGDRTTLTRSVDQLVADGVVERHVPAHDRRRVLLRLTEKGHDLYRQCVATLVGMNAEMIDSVPEGMRREVVRGLEAILRRLIENSTEADAICGFTNGEPAGDRAR